MRPQLITQVELNASNVPIVTLIDSYDPVGNRMARSVNGTVATWTHDDLYRLTGQMKPGQVCTYVLDGVGNLKVMWEGGSFPKTFTHDGADKIVTMIEGSNLTTYAWTGYGALASEITGTATTGYTYSGQDQLVVVSPPGAGFPTTYSFDGDGLRRTIQTTNVNQDPPGLDITTVVWDGSDYLFLNGPSSNSVILTLGGEIVSSGSFDLLPDSLCSVIGDIRSGQDPRVPFSYWPYGTMGNSGVKPGFPFLFVGSLGYYTDSTDRDYVRARELYKKLGRWMQQDELWPDERAFEYGGWNPVNINDPTGLQVALLPKNPDSMWSQPPFVNSNNCYCYACDIMRPGPGVRDWPNPGGPNCMRCTSDATSDSCSCKKLIECIAKDGFLQPRLKGRKCPPGYYTIIAFVKPTPPCDYHFARSLPNGKWCDKHGNFETCIPFDDPYEHNRRLGYTVVCQHYCARSKS